MLSFVSLSRKRGDLREQNMSDADIGVKSSFVFFSACQIISARFSRKASEEGISCGATKYCTLEATPSRGLGYRRIGIFAFFASGPRPWHRRSHVCDEHAFNGNERNERLSLGPVSRTQSIIKQMREIIFFSSLQHFGRVLSGTFPKFLSRLPRSAGGKLSP